MFDKLVFHTIINDVSIYLLIYLKGIKMRTIILVSALGVAAFLSGCGGSSDDAQFVPQEFVSISGKISNLNDIGEPGVVVEGVYSSPGGVAEPNHFNRFRWKLFT